MRRTALFLAGAGMGAAIAAALSFIPAHADVLTPYASVEVAPARLELPIPNTQPVTRTFLVTNLSTSPETVEILSADFTVSPDGSYIWLPANSTPWSIAPGLSITSSQHSLDIGPRSSIKVGLTYFPLTTTALRAGAILFEPKLAGPTASSGTGIVIKQQAIVPVLAIPAGSDGKLDSRVTLAGQPVSLDLVGALNIGPVSFQESGPLQVRAVYKNTGNAIARLDPWTTYSNLGQQFLSSEAPPAVALPGALARTSSSTVLSLPGQASRADVTPLFCICTIHASGSFVLLGETSPTVGSERLVIVAPWRVLGLLLAIFGGVWWGARRARREQIRRRIVREYLAEPDE